MLNLTREQRRIIALDERKERQKNSGVNARHTGKGASFQYPCRFLRPFLHIVPGFFASPLRAKSFIAAKNLIFLEFRQSIHL